MSVPYCFTVECTGVTNLRCYKDIAGYSDQIYHLLDLPTHFWEIKFENIILLCLILIALP